MDKQIATLSSLIDIYASHQYSQPILSQLKNNQSALFIKGFHGSSAPFFFSYLYETLADRSMLFVLNNLEDAGYFYHDLSKLLGDKKVLFFPSSYKRKVIDGQVDDANVIMRTEALAALENKQEVTIVTYPEALAEKVVSVGQFESSRIILTKRQEIDPSDLTEQLDNLNFDFVDYVYEPGQYAIRGSIIDVYSYSSEEPFRLDFFGEELESIRTFDISSQLSIEQLDGVTIIPKFVIKNEGRVSLLRFFSAKAPIIVKDLAWVIEAMDAQKELSLSDAARAVHDEAVNLDALFLHSTEFVEEFTARNSIQFGNKAVGNVKEYDFHAIQQPLFHKNFDLVTSTFAEYADRGYTLYVCSDSDKQHDRIDEIFKAHGAKFSFIAVSHTIHEGFIDKDLKVGLFTDHQIFDRYHKFSLRSERARAGKLTLSLKELTQFEVGDYVVHTDHGVGRFQGLMRIQQGTSTQEVMKLTYSRDDSVFVSIHSLHKVSKYKSKDGDAPRLSQLGSGAWERLKQKTKGKLKDIARDLIKLYSQRKKNKGFAFSPDSFMQRELEASFRYE
ncbi:MAG: CarD family transcriptional regulator, partial [Bacteroidaceae bacterium]